jgi:molybdopterin-guanine dinucleotide biosynthesis protein A
MRAEAPLAALVLAGGRSQRMQRDKAALEFGGETQLARAVRLVGRYAAETFVSVRPDQQDEAERRRFPQIVDRLADVGPAAGILAAQDTLPEHAWLVVAVDLPLLDAATLERLIGARDPRALATAYRSAEDGLPEPLCAIWEPASRAPLAAFVTGGKSCPRKFLLTHGARLVELACADALANVNTPSDYAAALARGAGGGAP